MDYLVLHTPEEQLPNALREKKQQQQRPPPTNPNMGGAVLVPKNQKAFLAPPIVVLPGMASRSAEMQAAQQTVVLPAMLKPKEERQVQELVSMGFGRGRVLDLSQLKPISLN